MVAMSLDGVVAYRHPIGHLVPISVNLRSWLHIALRHVFRTVTYERHNCTARRRQILRDGFDSRLEPIAFDIYVTGGC